MKEMIRRFWQVLNHDWVSVFVKYWKTSIRLYLVICHSVIGINIAFAFYTFSFIQGDHDWSRLISPIRIDSTFRNGRFVAY
jgi:hypothetical protein